MTDDFKLTLLKYFTGNLKQETGNNTPQFGGVEEVTNNLTTYLFMYIFLLLKHNIY